MGGAGLVRQLGGAAIGVGAGRVGRAGVGRAVGVRGGAGETGGPAVTAALVGLGRACTILGDSAAAGAALERGLAGARAAGDRAAEGQAQAGLAGIALPRGQRLSLRSAVASHQLFFTTTSPRSRHRHCLTLICDNNTLDSALSYVLPY